MVAPRKPALPAARISTFRALTQPPMLRLNLRNRTHVRRAGDTSRRLPRERREVEAFLSRRKASDPSSRWRPVDSAGSALIMKSQINYLCPAWLRSAFVCFGIIFIVEICSHLGLTHSWKRDLLTGGLIATWAFLVSYFGSRQRPQQ